MATHNPRDTTCIDMDQGTPCGVTELTADMPVPWPCAATPWPCLFRSRYGLRRVIAGGLLLSLLSTCAQSRTVTPCTFPGIPHP